jgi:hypothetical protein
MPDSNDKIERAVAALRTALERLPEGTPRQHALSHLDAVAIYARQALAPPGPSETTDH